MYRITIIFIYILFCNIASAQVQEKKDSILNIQIPSNTLISPCACNTLMQIRDSWNEMSPMEQHNFVEYSNYYQYKTMESCESNPMILYINLGAIELTCRQAVNYKRTTPQTGNYQWSKESIIKLEESKLEVPGCLCGK